MAAFIQIPPFENNKEFREYLEKSLPHRLFRIILYNPKDYENDRDSEIKAIINGMQFPVQADTCKIIRNANTVALAFDARTILRACIGKKKIDSLNKNRQQLLDVCQKIEDVLGEVSAINEMRDAISEYQRAVDKLLNFSKDE